MGRRKQFGHLAALTLFVLVCVLAAQFHAGAHLLASATDHGPGPDSHQSQGLKCHACAVGPWLAPATVSHLPGPMASVWFEGLPQPVLSSQGAFQHTASRAPPLA